MKGHALVTAFAFGAMCCVPATARAEVRAAAASSGYAIASWSTSDGRSLGPVRAITQDESGYLWLATESGLLRFDGFEFTNANDIVDHPMPAVPARALLLAASGDLWVGLGEGTGIYRIRQGRVSGGPVPGVTANVNAFAEEPASGTIWAAHDGGLLRFQGRGWEPVTLGSTAPGAVFHVRVEGQRLLVGSNTGFFVREADGDRFERVSVSSDGPVRDSTHDDGGHTWITDTRTGFHVIDRTTAESPGARGIRFLRDSRGNLWLATLGQGLWRLDPVSGAVLERITLRDGLLTDGIWSLLEDREQNLWVGTHEGLNRLTAHSVTPLLGLGLTSSITRGRDGVMWAASTDGVLAFTPSKAEPQPRFHRMQGVRTIHPAADGRVWVGTDEGLSRLDDERLRPVRLPSGEPLARVTAITSDADGTVWVADIRSGLWSWRNGSLRHETLPADLDDNRITSLLARDDGLWTVFDRGRLGVLRRDGSFTSFGPGDGLVHTNINAIQDGPKTGLWIAGSHGLSHFSNDRFTTIDRQSGLPARGVTAVVEDDNGGLWLAAVGIGIAHISSDQVKAALANPHYRLHVQVTDTSDGLAGMPTVLDSRTSARDIQGRLWFVTGRGLSLINPVTAFARPRASGPARIESAFANDRRFEPSANIVLPAGTNRLRIEYTAVTLSAPEHTRFRYRLEGFDQDWHDAGTNRQAIYTNLPPRAYRFLLQSETTDGVLKTTSANWPFRIAPRFYQTWSFYLTSMGALALVATGAWRLRLRHVHHEFEIVLHERARVARELHDTLLQTMAGAALHVDDVAKKIVPRGTDTERQLVAVRQAIEDGIVEARQAIWHMRASGERGDLASALEVLAGQITAGTRVRFRLSITGTPEPVGDHPHRELLRIAQEAVTNSVRHGRPTVVTIELRYGSGSLALRVSDDGAGFDVLRQDATHHFGLVTMQERTQQLGGRFSLTTAIGTGTQVEAVIPL